MDDKIMYLCVVAVAVIGLMGLQVGNNELATACAAGIIGFMSRSVIDGAAQPLQ